LSTTTSVSISGGTYTSAVSYAINFNIDNGADSSIAIAGATVASPANRALSFASSVGAVLIEDSNFTASSYTVYANCAMSATSSFNISRSTMASSSYYGLTLVGTAAGGSFGISDSVIGGVNYGYYHGVASTGATLNVTNSAITGVMTGMRIDGMTAGSLILSNVSASASNATGSTYGVLIGIGFDGQTVTVSQCAFSATYKGLSIGAVSGCTIAIENTTAAAPWGMYSDGAWTSTTLAVTGGSFGTGAGTAGANGVRFANISAGSSVTFTDALVSSSAVAAAVSVAELAGTISVTGGTFSAGTAAFEFPCNVSAGSTIDITDATVATATHGIDIQGKLASSTVRVVGNTFTTSSYGLAFWGELSHSNVTVHRHTAAGAAASNDGIRFAALVNTTVSVTQVELRAAGSGVSFAQAVSGGSDVVLSDVLVSGTMPAQTLSLAGAWSASNASACRLRPATVAVTGSFSADSLVNLLNRAACPSMTHTVTPPLTSTPTRTQPPTGSQSIPLPPTVTAELTLTATTVAATEAPASPAPTPNGASNQDGAAGASTGASGGAGGTACAVGGLQCWLFTLVLLGAVFVVAAVVVVQVRRAHDAAAAAAAKQQHDSVAVDAVGAPAAPTRDATGETGAEDAAAGDAAAAAGEQPGASADDATLVRVPSDDGIPADGLPAGDLYDEDL
jgi:hypothetical protein